MKEWGGFKGGGYGLGGMDAAALVGAARTACPVPDPTAAAASSSSPLSSSEPSTNGSLGWGGGSNASSAASESEFAAAGGGGVSASREPWDRSKPHIDDYLLWSVGGGGGGRVSPPPATSSIALPVLMDEGEGTPPPLPADAAALIAYATRHQRRPALDNDVQVRGCRLVPVA